MSEYDKTAHHDHDGGPGDGLLRGLRLLCVLLLLVLLVCWIVFLATSGCDQILEPFTGRDTDTNVDTEAETAPADDPLSPDEVVLPETPDAGVAYQDRLTFLGDSLTAHLVNRGVLTGGTETRQVLRTAGNMLNLDSGVTQARVCIPGTDRYVTIAEATAELQPEILVITLGTDYGVSYLTEKDFKAYYAKLISAIRATSPDTILILQSIFPVTADCAVLSNEKIDRANVWVREVAAETGCRYLDTQSVLKGDDGCLRPELCISEDGIHLTTEAYRLILNYIRTHAYSA